jgi:uncharacterized protein (TIGR02596 family)
MNISSSHSTSWREAFTLIELLVVVSIMVLIASFVAPAFNQMSRTATLTTAGQDFVDSLNLARQTAMTRNLRVEVRLFQLPSLVNSSDVACRAYQLFLKKYDGSLLPITKVVRFPEPVILSDSKSQTLVTSSSTSSLLVPLDVSGTGSTTDSVNTASMWPVPAGPSNYAYVSFDFLPTGETSLAAGINGAPASWLATLILENSPLTANNLPANFLTVWLDPSTGKAAVFRP